MLHEGTFTGQNQAAWSVTGNDQYVAYAGEFPSVNNVPQQGLVRFTVRSQAPNKRGPEATGENWATPVASLRSGIVRIGFQLNWDRDDTDLTYSVYRDGDMAHPLFQAVRSSTFWRRPFTTLYDANLAPGSKHTYRISATDPTGNTAWSATKTVQVSDDATLARYHDRVRGLGAVRYYRFGELSGATAYDWASSRDAPVGAGVKLGAAGAANGGNSYTFSGGADSLVILPSGEYGAPAFTLQAMVKTTAKTWGQVIGFGDSNKTVEGQDVSYNNDRVVYMQPNGHVAFGVYDRAVITLVSPNPINDGKWHQVTASFTRGSMKLYVDGALVASRDDAATAGYQYGYWRIGGDSLRVFNGSEKASNFVGNLDEIAIYPGAMSPENIAALYALR